MLRVEWNRSSSQLALGVKTRIRVKVIIFIKLEPPLGHWLGTRHILELQLNLGNFKVFRKNGMEDECLGIEKIPNKVFVFRDQ